MFDLGPDLPDDTLVEMVRLPTRIRNAAKFRWPENYRRFPRNHGCNLCPHPKFGTSVSQMVARSTWRTTKHSTS